jgi:hypothetical protein
LLDANRVEASPASTGGGELLPDDWLEEGEGKRKGLVLLCRFSGIDAAVVI